MRKAPCINADQSTMQGTRNQDHEGVLMPIVYHGPLPIARRKVILIFPTKSTKWENSAISIDLRSVGTKPTEYIYNGGSAGI